MANNIWFCCGLFLLVAYCEGRPSTASVQGRVTRTKVRNFRFFARIANPCEIGPAAGSGTSVIAPTTTESTANTLSYYQLIASSIEMVQDRLRTLEQTDHNSECNGISLDSLPTTPPLDNLNIPTSINQAYKSAINLATHFHLISFDRQLAPNAVDDQPEDQLEDNVPSWRYRRCGNETESFPLNVEEVSTQLEGLICTILTGASEEQRASFRQPMNELQSTVLYRYHTSCSLLRTRDCLVFREAKQATELLLRKFQGLVASNGSSNSNGSALNEGAENEDDMMDNSL